MNLEASKPAFEQYGKEVIKQARANLTRNDMNVTRELYRSLSYRVKVSPNSIEQSFSTTRYGPKKGHRVKPPRT